MWRLIFLTLLMTASAMAREPTTADLQAQLDACSIDSQRLAQDRLGLLKANEAGIKVNADLTTQVAALKGRVDSLEKENAILKDGVMSW
jgi:hypothetical protein